MSLPFPLAGATLIVGPSGAGKTRLTHRALAAWVAAEGPEDVVVLEFAPEFERNGRVLGGRLDRFGPLPEGIHLGRIEAHAPRAQGGTEAEAVSLARENAERAAGLFDALPASPRAVFVNDATIPFQHDRGDVDALTGYADRAACAVVNAFESDELGTNDPVSYQERRALARLHGWADRTVELGADA